MSKDPKHFVTELPKHGDTVLNTKKETIYKVFGISRHTETQEACVVYSDLWGVTHHRPLNEFVGYRWSESLEEFVPRFELLTEEDWENACLHDNILTELGRSTGMCGKCGKTVPL